MAGIEGNSNVLDLAIIGAGIYGIQAARTYLSLHSSHNVLLFESSGCIGGVWSSERVYDVFWTQTPLGILEFSDMLLRDVLESDQRYGFFTARHVSRYLETYVETRIYNGQSIADRVRLCSKVSTVTRKGDHWYLEVENWRDGKRATTYYHARKVIDATGLTSTAKVPSIIGRDRFKGIVLHHKDFGKQQEFLLSASGSRKVVVIGGAKSAADVAYASALAKKDVTWVIRRSGAGPAAFVAAKGRGMYKNSNESFYTRFVANFLVSFFMDDSKSWIARFLNRTAVGRKCLQSVWKGINRKAHALANYDRSDGKNNGFYNLRPDTDIFWQNDSTGICQHEDFFDVIATQVKVYREDVKCFQPTAVELADGTVIDADVVIFATGWRASHPRYRDENSTENLGISLGLSIPYDSYDPKSSTEWDGRWEDLQS